MTEIDFHQFCDMSPYLFKIQKSRNTNTKECSPSSSYVLTTLDL